VSDILAGVIWALAVLATLPDLDLRLELQYGPSCANGWAITDVQVIGESAPHIYELEWHVAGDIQDGVFVEKRRLERTRWKRGDPLPCRTDLATWARAESHPLDGATEISCGTRGHIHGHRYGDHTVELCRLDGAKDAEISLDGKPLTHGELYGAFGHYLVVTADERSPLAVADIFDLSTRKKVQHVTFNRLGPLHFDDTSVRLYVATEKTCSAQAVLPLEPGAKPVFDRDGKQTRD
jgi:hypothetical protein